MVFTEYVKLRILYHYNNGLKPYTISKVLMEEEGIKASKVGIMKSIKVYLATGTTGRRSGSGRPSKITQLVKDLVEAQMKEDDETTATQLHRMLNDKGIDISLRTILRYDHIHVAHNIIQVQIIIFHYTSMYIDMYALIMFRVQVPY